MRAAKAACRDNPAKFNRVVLGRPLYWWRQAEIADSVRDHPITLVPAGNAVGKSYVDAGVILWFLANHTNALVIATAPTQVQLEEVLWKEVERAYNSAAMPLHKSARVLRSPLKIDFGGGWQALAYSTNKTERLSGHHAADLLAVIDEGSGVEDPIWEAIDSLNPSRLLVTGNPIQPDGQFYLRCKSAPDNPLANLIRVPSLESPDIHLPRSRRGLADATWLQKARLDYGEDSLWWKSHVLAEFPDATEDTLIPPAWVDRCAEPGIVETCERLRQQGKGGRRRMSADLGYGTGADRTVIVVADDLGVLHLESSSSLGVPETAHRLAVLAGEWRVSAECVVYDANGPGRDLPRYLEQHRLEAQPYHGSGKGGTKHANKRSRCAWRLRQRLDPARPTQWEPPPADDGDPWKAPPIHKRPEPQPPFAIPPQYLSAKAREELKALRYHMDKSKIALELKEDLVKRLGRSPDIADALIMLFSLGGGE